MINNEKEYDQAVDRAIEADAAYYVHDTPIMSDEDYDALVREIAEFEKRTGIRLRHSPTQRVSGAVATMFQKVKHPRKMLSLANVFSEEEVGKFCKDVQKDGATKFIVEPKLDGLTVVCHYFDGTLLQAVTRGDGDVGEDVTATARTIRNLPLKVSTTHEFWARGEVIINKADFEALNAELVKAGKPPFANTRNAAAGSLRQKDPAEAAKRKLQVCFYDIHDGGDAHDEDRKLIALEMAGLPTLLNASDIAKDAKEVFALCQSFHELRSQMSFDIDGAVIKAVDGNVQAARGEGNKTPNWAVAFKFPAEQVATTVRAVRWQVGRTGKLTPVADVVPVQIAGTMVQHASLHNADYIKALELCIGDAVLLYKAAEIIPQISTVLDHKGDELVEIPDKCPVCGGKIVRDGAELRCTSSFCKGKARETLEFFGSREHMDIKGLGPAVIAQLVEAGMDTPEKLYMLKKDTLLMMEGWSDTKANSLLAEIEKSKDRPFDRVLASLGVENLGDTLSVDAARKFKTMDAVQDATVEDWCELNGVAEPSAKAIVAGLHEPTMRWIIGRLKTFGLKMAVEDNGLEQTLEGKSFCITGTLSVGREEMKALILGRGGIFQSSVSSKTNYLVVGTGGGSKADKAKKLGVKTITEEELRKMIDG